MKHGKWPPNSFPFEAGVVPITMTAKARKIPEWKLDRHGLCAVLQDSPVISDEPEETVTLIPMGAARLRISAFPVIGSGAGAQRWVETPSLRAPLYKASASHCFGGDSVAAIDDGMQPTSSHDTSMPRLTWWDHRGTQEWVCYDFPEAREVSGIGVYWFDDTGVGQCRIPKSWRLAYRDGQEWKPVAGATSEAPAKDQWNRVEFPAVKTTGLRLEVQLQPGFSGGILEWSVK